jgi:hypothetical protein
MLHLHHLIHLHHSRNLNKLPPFWASENQITRSNLAIVLIVCRKIKIIKPKLFPEGYSSTTISEQRRNQNNDEGYNSLIVWRNKILLKKIREDTTKFYWITLRTTKIREKIREANPSQRKHWELFFGDFDTLSLVEDMRSKFKPNCLGVYCIFIKIYTLSILNF